jgi:hypothetical protein
MHYYTKQKHWSERTEGEETAVHFPAEQINPGSKKHDRWNSFCFML